MRLIRWSICALTLLAILALPSSALAAPSPDGPVNPAYTCWIATVVIDTDCDGLGNIGWNEQEWSVGMCYDTLGDMQLHAERNYECWWPEGCTEVRGTECYLSSDGP